MMAARLGREMYFPWLEPTFLPKAAIRVAADVHETKEVTSLDPSDFFSQCLERGHEERKLPDTLFDDAWPFM